MVLVGLFSLSGTVPVWSAPARIAVIDMESVLKAYHKTAKAEAEIDRQKTEYKAELGRMRKHQDELDGQFEAARAAAREAGLDDKTMQERLAASEDKLMQVKEYEHQVMDYAEKGKKQLQDQSMRIRNQLRGEIRECVKKLAGKQGYALVLDISYGVSEWGSYVVFTDETIDISKQVLELLNAEEPAKKSD
jgi:Skp family chaperone for outer membrane proteins